MVEKDSNDSNYDYEESPTPIDKKSQTEIGKPLSKTYAHREEPAILPVDLGRKNSEIQIM